MNEKNIKISNENLNIIKNLNPGDLITIKHRNLRGKVILRVLDDNIKSNKK
jgi:hypothetical protein